MRAPRLLVVSVSTGTGHVRAAEAVCAAMARRHPSVEVKHVDLLELAPRWVKAFYGKAFEKVATHAPSLWKEIYHATDGDEQDSARWAAAADRLVFREFRRVLHSGRWNACLSTHFLPCQLASGGGEIPPISLVVTDFTLHRVWVQPRASRYFVATEDLVAQLARRAPGVPAIATGIPVSPEVAATGTREEARAALGVGTDRRMALIVGGGLGIGVEEAAREALQAAPRDVQLVAVCGRNESARERLLTLGQSAERLQVHGYVRGLNSWMAAANLVATKPGGLSLSEGLALGCPLLLTRPIPGAEEGNARVAAENGAALVANTADEIRAAFARSFSEPGLLERLATSARRLGRPDAADRVADALAESLPARV
ncbi:MAG TPA: glycosyltransferase [Longimicrobium sp.]|nr:glycosyltransferase [Longimicrobium sp.]